MLRIDPKHASLDQLSSFLKGAVAPRPIALVSSVDPKGQLNLAPYSFFNLFSINPPILVFSTTRKTGLSPIKDTLKNARSAGEVTINVVSYHYARKMAITSINFDAHINEYQKSGLTAIPSEMVAPPRVEEAPVQFECLVEQIHPLGAHYGAGHLIVCRIILIHAHSFILNEREKISPHKIDLIGRMGSAYYVRASGESIHTIYQPTASIGIGYDQLPPSAQQSTILTANNLGQLAGITAPPAQEDIMAIATQPEIIAAIATDFPIQSLHRIAQIALAKEETDKAAAMIWLADQYDEK